MEAERLSVAFSALASLDPEQAVACVGSTDAPLPSLLGGKVVEGAAGEVLAHG